MSNNNIVNNQRIAKNTLLLYIRMLFTMGISLYTSRAILQVLGVIDYGIYNVVGGIVVLFIFLSNAMTTSTQRFITYELGNGNLEQLRNVFVTSVNIHILISIIVVFLSETIGLWLFDEKMTIPPDRKIAAMWVFQLSILTCVISVMSYPYNAVIIAYEKMSFFAYISVFEALLKLAIVYLLLIGDTDRLITYAVLMALVQLFIRFCYSLYCNRHFPATSYKIYYNKRLFCEMLVFAGWNLWGNLASILGNQGINILLNIFFSPAVNAARALTISAQGAIRQLTTNFQMALNPQIIKSYAAGQLHDMHQLVFRSSKFSYFLLFVICLPVFMETPFILDLWLKEVPDYTVIFLRFAIIGMLLEGTSNPLMTSAAATGNVKVYQSVVGCIYLLVLPISYISLKLGCAPWSVYIADIFVTIFAYAARLIIISQLIQMSMLSFLKCVLFRVIIVTVISCIIPWLTSITWSEETFIRHIVLILISALCALLCSFFIGFDYNERKMCTNYIANNIAKVRK